MSAGFVHLHLHTEFSLVDGLVRIKPLMKSLAAAGMPAVALTDQSNLFAMVKFYRAALAAGIKPIIGVELLIRSDDERNPATRLVLLCQNNEGYLNLNRLITLSYTEGQKRGIPMIERNWLEGATDGLIALSGGRAGDIGQALIAGDKAGAVKLLDYFSGLFPDRFYLELTRTSREKEETYLHAAVELAQKNFRY